MTLIMPRAGTNPGRAAQAGEVVMNETGGAVSDIGQVLGDIGTTLRNDHLDRQFKRNQVDLTRDLNDLRLEIEGIGDPDSAEARWASGVQGLKNAYAAPDEAGGLRVAQRNMERFDLAFDEMANAHAYKLGARNLDLRMAQHEATFINYTNEAVRAAPGSDAQTRDVLIAQGDQQIDSMEAAGVIDAADAAEKRIRLRNEITEVAAEDLLVTDPALFLAVHEDQYPDMPPDTRLKFVGVAQNAIEDAAQLAIKQDEKALKDQVSAASSNLSRIASLNDTKRLSAQDRAFLEDPDILALAEADADLALDRSKALARVSLDEEKTLFRAMSPRELRVAIANERASEVAHPFQEERLAVLEDFLATAEQKIAENAIGHLETSGFVPADLPLDQGPAAFEAGLSRRVRDAQWMQDEGFTEEFVIFKPAESRALKAQLDVSADPEQRLTLVSGMARVLGREAQGVIEEATGDRVIAHAATLTNYGARPDVVAQILRGQKLLADGAATRPARADLRDQFSLLTGDQFSDQPEFLARLLDSTEAIYADLNPNGDSTSLDAGKMRQAINRALGGDGAGGGGMARVDPEGLFNGYDIILPPGLSAPTVEQAIAAASEELLPRAVFDHSQGGWAPTPDAEDFSRFQQASVDDRGQSNSARPVLGDHKSVAFGNMQIQPWWPDGQPADRYVLMRMTASGPVAVLNDQGDVFYFSLRKFVGGGRP